MGKTFPDTEKNRGLISISGPGETSTVDNLTAYQCRKLSTAFGKLAAEMEEEE